MSVRSSAATNPTRGQGCYAEDRARDAIDSADDSDPRILKFVDLIITEAISLRASELHIEPSTGYIRVRCGIDGILVERDVSSAGIGCFSIRTTCSRNRFMAVLSAVWKASSATSII